MTQKINPILLDLPTEIVGERVLLRPFRDDDAPALWQAVEDSREHLQPWMPWVSEHNSLEFSREYIRRMQAKWILREDLPMGIWRRDDGRLLGATGLHRFDWSVPVMETGYWLRPDAEGQGYMTEVVELLAGFAFDYLHAERLEIRCDAANARSAAVPPRAGYVMEARLRFARRNMQGQLGDTLAFALTRADFEKLRDKTASRKINS